MRVGCAEVTPVVCRAVVVRGTRARDRVVHVWCSVCIFPVTSISKKLRLRNQIADEIYVIRDIIRVELVDSHAATGGDAAGTPHATGAATAGPGAPPAREAGNSRSPKTT